MAAPLSTFLRQSPRKQWRETIVLVHHYGGRKESVRRHQDFLSELGFDSLSFTLPSLEFSLLKPLAPLQALRHSLRQEWTERITQVLDETVGSKILYSFSFPSVSALSALAQRQPQQSDVKAWICDGGPFLQLPNCLWNYFTVVEKTPLTPVKLARVSFAFQAMGGLHLGRDLRRSFAQLPAQFPVLNIRSWQDPLVPVAAIDAAFRGGEHLHLETLTLPEAGHVDGIVTARTEYESRVSAFLTRFGSRL